MFIDLCTRIMYCVRECNIAQRELHKSYACCVYVCGSITIWRGIYNLIYLDYINSMSQAYQMLLVTFFNTHAHFI